MNVTPVDHPPGFIVGAAGGRPHGKLSVFAEGMWETEAILPDERCSPLRIPVKFISEPNAACPKNMLNNIL